MNDLIDKTTDVLIDVCYRDYAETARPKAYLVVGQPGAGKTQIIREICKEKDIAYINGDGFRKFYPEYHELYRKHGDELVNITKGFSGAITERLIEKLSDKRLDLIIEGTLRTTDVPEKTRALLSQKGYKTELDLIVVKPEISWLRTRRRYEEMKKEGMTPRMTPKDHHDKVVKSLLSNLKALYQSKKFDEIKLYQQKEGVLTVIYSMEKTPETDPSMIVEKEFQRKYTTKEIPQIKDEFKNYISEDELNDLFEGKAGETTESEI